MLPGSSPYDSPAFFFTGVLTRLFLLLPSGKMRLDVPGGNLLYAAAGAAVWEPPERVGLLARVGEDYPRTWIDGFAGKGFNTHGIRILPGALDLRFFLAYTDLSTRHSDDPVPHFARLQQTLPRPLLGYTNPFPRLDSRTTLQPYSIRQSDIPEPFLDATAAHLCSVDFLTHSLLPAILRQNNFSTITLDPSPAYMTPEFWNLVPSLVTGLTAFMPSEEDLRTLFRGRSEDLWEMAEALAAYGCEFIIIKRGLRGQWLYDAAAKKRWEIPAYPNDPIDPTGAGDAFCGGFLAGYRQTFDPLQACLHGGISASLTIEGSDPLYALDALPRLAMARLDALRPNVHRM